MQKQIIGSIAKGIVASDLLEERKKCNFDQEEFFNLILTKKHVDYFKRSIEIMESDPILKNTHKYYDMTREEQMVLGMQKVKRGVQLHGFKFFQEDEMPGANALLWN